MQKKQNLPKVETKVNVADLNTNKKGSEILQEPEPDPPMITQIRSDAGASNIKDEEIYEKQTGRRNPKEDGGRDYINSRRQMRLTS